MNIPGVENKSADGGSASTIASRTLEKLSADKRVASAASSPSVGEAAAAQESPSDWLSDAHPIVTEAPDRGRGNLRFETCLRIRKYGVMFSEHRDPDWLVLDAHGRSAMEQYIHSMSMSDIREQLDEFDLPEVKRLGAAFTPDVVVKLLGWIRTVYPDDVARLPPTTTRDVLEADRCVRIVFNSDDDLRALISELTAATAASRTTIEGLVRNRLRVVRSAPVESARMAAGEVDVRIDFQQRASPVFSWYVLRGVFAVRFRTSAD